ncbi:MAG: STAS domain-containing protein [Bdellovibrionales bacterium]|nr:STAS domain-containing protein [Bdellovibrionales bacterium]
MREFDYKIITQNNVTIISFSGKISKESKEQLETCRQEIISDSSQTVILYLKDVTKIEPCIFRELTLLQHEARKNSNELYVAGLDNQIRQYLVDRAVIRLGEIKKTLIEIFEHKKKMA